MVGLRFESGPLEHLTLMGSGGQGCGERETLSRMGDPELIAGKIRCLDSDSIVEIIARGEILKHVLLSERESRVTWSQGLRQGRRCKACGIN